MSGADGRVYVSEIGEFGADGDGRISVIDKDGQARVFADGMNDPKGLAFYGNTLYVADKTRVLAVGIDGKWSVYADTQAFPAPPQFLNDVETDASGNVYVSESGDLQGKGASQGNELGESIWCIGPLHSRLHPLTPQVGQRSRSTGDHSSAVRAEPHDQPLQQPIGIPRISEGHQVEQPGDATSPQRRQPCHPHRDQQRIVGFVYRPLQRFDASSGPAPGGRNNHGSAIPAAWAVGL